MDQVSVRIYSADTYSGSSVQIIFEVTNHGDSDVNVLKRHTPLEGMLSDCLIVTRGKVRIPYDGVKAKRLPPAPHELVHLAPGQTVSSKIDLSESYPLSGKGGITVDFDRKNLIVYPGSPPDSTSLALSPMTTAKTTSVKVQSHAATLKVTAKKRPTVGEQFRDVQKKSELTEALVAGPRPPVIKADQPGDREKMIKAHEDGYQLTVDALARLKNDGRYTEWFGKFTNARLNKVKASYEKVRARMTRTKFTYVCHGGSSCDSTTIAYTTIGGATIWLCTSFWNAGARGTDSKAGTMVHEHSHASAGTDDMEYTQGPCRTLAKKKPNTAIKNADNYEYYAGG